MPLIPKGGGFVKAAPLLRAPAAPVAETADFERATEAHARRTSEHPLLGGRVLVVGALSTDVTKVNHGLGRVPSGWFPIQKTGNSDVWEGAAADREALYLVATTTDAEFTLWVF